MNKLLILILIPFLILNCSFNPNSKIWNKEKERFKDNKNLKKINFDQKKPTEELNASIKINLSNIKKQFSTPLINP